MVETISLNSMNSLAEVGVGINLAYGLLKGLRDGLSNLFEANLKIKVQTLKADLNDVQDGDTASNAAIKAEDIRQMYSNFAGKLTTVFVLLAVLSAISLVFFLVESSLTPDKVVDSVWVFVAVLCAIGSMVFASLFHLMLYGGVRIALWWKLKDYEAYARIKHESNAKISPKSFS